MGRRVMCGAMIIGACLAASASAAPAPTGGQGDADEARVAAVAALPQGARCAAGTTVDQDTVWPCVLADGSAIAVAPLVFDYDKARLKPQSVPVLDALAELMLTLPEIARVEVQGHRDAFGAPSFGLRLTLKRAQAVMEQLIARGVPAARLEAQGYGPDRPIAPNDTAEGRAKNRRIDFVVRRWEAPALEGDPAVCTKACVLDGKCLPRAGRCVAESDAKCRAARACATHGACALTGLICGAGSDLDCSRTVACTQQGLCGLAERGRCRPTQPDHCLASRACTQDGRCGFQNGACTWTTNAHCRRSDMCKRHGACTLAPQPSLSPEGPACVALRSEDCEASDGCAADGLCGAFEGRCVARTDAECRDSAACAEYGRCTVTPPDDPEAPGTCIIGSSRDCQRSSECKEHGRCVRLDRATCAAR